MRLNSKLILGLVLSCWTFSVSADSTVVGRIEDFDGNNAPFEMELEDDSSQMVPSAYILLRNHALVPVELLTELQASDVIVVNDTQHFLLIRFADNSVEKVTAKNSPYVVVTKGEVPSVWANIKHWVSGLTQRHQEEVTAVSVSTKGGSTSSPVIPLLEVKTGEPTKTLIAGNRSLYLAWRGGKAGYQVTLRRSGEEKSLLVQAVKERTVQLPEFSFTPGNYEVLLTDSKDRQVTHSFTVVEGLPIFPKELSEEALATLSEAARRTVQAAWLAEQENGKWSLEAYQRAAETAKGYHFAQVLREALASRGGVESVKSKISKFQENQSFRSTKRNFDSQSFALYSFVKCPTAEHQQRLQTTRFAHFRRLNALELKGIHDPLTLLDYNRIMMRVWGLGALQTGHPKENPPEVEDDGLESSGTLDEVTLGNYLNRLPSQRTLTLVCVTKPNKLLKLTEEFHFHRTAEVGVYHCPARIPQWLIYPTELELKPINYPLLPLARGQKLKDFITLCVKEDLRDYLFLTLRIGLTADPSTIWQYILEVQRMDVYEPGQYEATIPYIERYFQAYPEVLKRLSITNALLAEQLQMGLQQGKLQGIQQFLLRQLQRKFTVFPEAVKQRVEATTNLEQLETWLTQVFTANSLAETELGSCAT